MNTNNPLIDKDTAQFLIEASSEEYSLLFNYWSEICGFPWKEQSLGGVYTIGYLDNRPLCVTLTYAFLGGVPVAFYYGSSQLVDHERISQWINKEITCLKTPDSDGRRRHTNATNFGHAIAYVESITQLSLLKRYHHDAAEYLATHGTSRDLAHDA